MDTDTLTKPDVSLVLEGDHDKFSHYSKKPDIARSAITGEPIVALCGKVWVPTSEGRGLTVCPTCKDIFENVVQP